MADRGRQAADDQPHQPAAAAADAGAPALACRRRPVGDGDDRRLLAEISHAADLPAASLIACLAWVNFFLTLRYPPTHRLEPPAAFALLGLDLAAALRRCFFITGGLANPFAALVCVPVIISFASQPIRYSIALIVLAMICITGACLFALSAALVSAASRSTSIASCSSASGVAIASTMAFAAFYAYRVSHGGERSSPMR